MNHQRISNTISFKGRGGEFFGIWIVNVLLSIVTLGIYSAWAKVRTKRYFYGNTYIDGDNFEYHAEPMQILKGRLVALAIVLLWGIANSFIPQLALVLLLLFYVALPWLLWSNARFDSAMTSYRNVHFSFNSSLKDAYISILGRGFGAALAVMVFIGICVAVASVSQAASVILGLCSVVVMAALYGWVVVGVQRYFVNGYRYGDWQFSGELETSFFVKTYLKAVAIGLSTAVALAIVAVIVMVGSSGLMEAATGDLASLNESSPVITMVVMYLGMIGLTIGLTAYTATRTRNYLFSQMKLEKEGQEENNFTFKSTYTVDGYMWLIISNFLLQVVTLSIARPWVMVRTSRYVADKTIVVGDMSQLKAADQDSKVKSAISDEVAQAFDLGVGIG
ncbi:YjgN family protein [Vibrio owensii]|uniref:Membrane protein n=1 Tax=Vibrio owensii CAIM 1854 = LMG 25443 TaxID=1229493 RepID=A0A0C1ZC16_9VIBR|nr:YjgN family protein [Vibrio owensii]KIF54680.1 membrane protein [Vibrio owensii CAIM 1854 = LMG 25443]